MGKLLRAIGGEKLAAIGALAMLIVQNLAGEDDSEKMEKAADKKWAPEAKQATSASDPSAADGSSLGRGVVRDENGNPIQLANGDTGPFSGLDYVGSGVAAYVAAGEYGQLPVTAIYGGGGAAVIGTASLGVVGAGVMGYGIGTLLELGFEKLTGRMPADYVWDWLHPRAVQ